MIMFHMHWAALVAPTGTAIALIALSLSAVAHSQAGRARTHSLSLESTLEALRHDVASTVAIAARAARQLQHIEQEYVRMTERMHLVEAGAQARSFEQAIDSARHGADPGRLSESFGLSRGEAELISRLHGRKKSA